MSIKLSICIPTYNRADYIGETLDSIVNQATDAIEIVISDNASTDETSSIVLDYMKIFPNIIYFRSEVNMGADLNYLKVVDLASGEYCWLLGSDDTLKADSIDRVLHEIKSGFDIYLCNRTECNIIMEPYNEKKWLDKKLGDTVFDFEDEKEYLNYFGFSKSLGAVFSYLSSIIVRKESWDRQPYNSDYIGSAYSHVFKLLGVLNEKIKLKYICDSLVNCRGGNDSFATEGVLKRFQLDINGYSRLAKSFYDSNSKLKVKFLKILLHEHPFWRIVNIRSVCSNAEWTRLRYELEYVGFSKLKLFLIGQIGRMSTFVKLLVIIKRKAKDSLKL